LFLHLDDVGLPKKASSTEYDVSQQGRTIASIQTSLYKLDMHDEVRFQICTVYSK